MCFAGAVLSCYADDVDVFQNSVQQCSKKAHQSLNISACFSAFFPSSVPLVDCGRVLSCGSNAFGQLGVGTTVTQSADVNLVEVSKFPNGHAPFDALLSQMQ